MQSEIRNYVLDQIVNTMNIPLDDSVDQETPLGPAGVDLDSLSLMELVAYVEKEYSFKVPDEDYEKLAGATLGEFVDYVAEHGAKVG